MVELAFSRNSLKGFLRVLDTILEVGAVGWKQPDDFIGAVGSHMADRTGGEQNGLTDAVLMLFHAFLLDTDNNFALFERRAPSADGQYSAKRGWSQKILLSARISKGSRSRVA
jgi:hypothetical protein